LTGPSEVCSPEPARRSGADAGTIAGVPEEQAAKDVAASPAANACPNLLLLII
jgi:hypothetical protein